MGQDECRYCGRTLAGLETIWACEGYLFCSQTCGVNSYAEYYNEPADGIEHAKCYFDKYAEEINPKDIGIK